MEEIEGMAGLLSGLSRFGLSSLESVDVYENDTQEKAIEVQEVKKASPVVEEQDFLFSKSYKCPICGKDFKVRTVKAGRARLIGSDADLRPKYENIDALKYDVILCPGCGYAALSRFFKFITVHQAKNIKEKISANFKPSTAEEKDSYTYDEALARYKLTLVNAIVKLAKPSEKAYICLKTAWVLRGKGEQLDKGDKQYEEKKEKLETEEKEFLKNAFDGFITARQSEPFPICGMDESTVDYLISVLAVKFEQYDVASKLISNVISSPAANSRMKDRARTLKEEIVKQVKKQNAAKA